MGSRYQILGASSPIAKHRVPLRPIVLEYQCSCQISPIRRDHMSFFLRKCSPTRKRSLASSLLLPFGRHTPSAAPEPCALTGACSFLRDRRSTNPRKCRRSEFLLACPNYGTVFLQNVKISARVARRQYWLFPALRFAKIFIASEDHAYTPSLAHETLPIEPCKIADQESQRLGIRAVFDKSVNTHLLAKI